MATWFFPSHLLLVALLSWNVHCYPATKGWSQSDPYEGSFSNMEAPSGVSYNSFQGAPAQPSSVSYPVSTTSYTSQPGPDVGLPPPPPLYQAGELEHYEENLEHGDLERETEELSFPAPPPPPYPGPDFQAGELSRYESVYEHGNTERETEDQGFMPVPPYLPAELGAEELSAHSISEEGPKELVSEHLRPIGPSYYYLFLTGQLPPGAYSHFQSDYETGSDHWDEDHYERYHYPNAQSPIIPTQTEEVPSYSPWQQPQDYTKA